MQTTHLSYIYNQSVLDGKPWTRKVHSEQVIFKHIWFRRDLDFSRADLKILRVHLRAPVVKVQN